jgi:hypothetical protein
VIEIILFWHWSLAQVDQRQQRKYFSLPGAINHESTSEIACCAGVSRDLIAGDCLLFSTQNWTIFVGPT